VNLQDIMKAAQSLQENMASAQNKLDQIEVEGAAGGGVVKARCTAKGKLVRLSIDPSLFKPEDREVVEDLIVAAITDAQRKAAATAESEMSKLTAGLPLPPGMKLPF
jgi:nucleoid-associated protein EbfC